MQHRCDILQWHCSKSWETIKEESFKRKNSLPDASNILAHAAEVLKQVEGAGIEKMVGS